MTLTNPSGMVSALSTALADCASWAAAIEADVPGAIVTDRHWFPKSNGSNTQQLFAVLGTDSGRQFSIIIISTTLSEGELEQLAWAISLEIMSIYRTDGTGIVITEQPDVDQCGVPSEGQVAGNHPAKAILITGTYGVDL